MTEILIAIGVRLGQAALEEVYQHLAQPPTDEQGHPIDLAELQVRVARVRADAQTGATIAEDELKRLPPEAHGWQVTPVEPRGDDLDE